jgi:excisionase family DNA binding protein
MGVWMTRHEAANYLKVSMKTIDRWIRDGKLPAAKQGRIVRLRRDDLDAFMLQSRQSQDRESR